MDTPYVRESVDVLDPDHDTLALGAPLGRRSHINNVVEDTVRKTADLREAICGIGHSATELVLTRQCVDVSKLAHHMRLNGDRIDPELLARLYGDLRAALETIAGGELRDISWWQASLGVAHGGLGLRQAQTVATAAFVASRIASRPQVEELSRDMETSGLGTRRAIMAAYDARTEDAMLNLVATLPPDSGVELANKLEHAADCAADVWRGLFNNGQASVDEELPRSPHRTGAASHLLPDDGEQDAEHPDTPALGRTLRIPRMIVKHIDIGTHATSTADLRESGDFAGLRRLSELSGQDVDHTWLWRLSKHR